MTAYAKVRLQERITKPNYQLLAVIALGLLVVGARSVAENELEGIEWVEVRTANFIVYSTLNKEDSIEVARTAEAFRAAIGIVLNVSLRASPIPTEIYILDRQDRYPQMGSGRDWYLLRKNAIYLLRPHHRKETKFLAPGYVRFVARNQGSTDYPRWFDEGLAQYLGFGHTLSGQYVIGDAEQLLGYRRWNGSFRRMKQTPLRQIITPEGYDDWAKIYPSASAEKALAVVHYLSHRPERGVLLGQDMTQYVAQLKAGKSHIEAFEATFDITATDLDLEVRRYFKKALVPNYRLNIDKVVPDFAPKVTVLTSERTSLVFAQAALLNGQLDTAEQWFTIAATFEDVRPQAESGLGSVLVEREDFDAAQAHFEKAVALAPDDPYVQLDIAKYWSARAKNSVGTVDQFANVARAREHFINAWKIDASMPEVYALYGETFLLGDKDYDRAIEMLQHAERLLPSSISVRLSLAESYFGASRFAEAESSARLVLRWSQSETDAVERAQAVLDRLPTNR